MKATPEHPVTDPDPTYTDTRRKTPTQTQDVDTRHSLTGFGRQVFEDLQVPERAVVDHHHLHRRLRLLLLATHGGRRRGTRLVEITHDVVPVSVQVARVGGSGF